MPSPSCTPDEASESLREALARLFAGHDADGAVSLALEALDQGRVPVARLYCAVLAPLLADVGARWHSGSARVWEEHLESAAIRAVIESARPHVRAAYDAVRSAHADEPPRRALFACPPEEWHVLGLRMLADRFKMEGWDSYYLGADVPVEDLVDAARSLGVELVVVTTATGYERLRLRELVDDIRGQLGDVRLLVGGPAFSHDLSGWAADELLDPDEIPAAYV